VTRRLTEALETPYGQRIKPQERSIEGNRQGVPSSGPFREMSLVPTARQGTVVDSRRELVDAISS
jgi:hypothetical protein